MKQNSVLERLFGTEKERAGHFPNIDRAMRASREKRPMARGAEFSVSHTPSQPLMEIYYVGCEKNSNTIEVLCWLEAPSGGIANIFSAAIIDSKGNEIDREDFVSFDAANAAAKVEVSRDIYRECRVTLVTAAISDTVNIGEQTYPLSDYQVFVPGETSVAFDIDHPVKDPKYSHTGIQVAYVSSSGNYDYKYPAARSSDKVHLASEGTVTVSGAKISKVDPYLWMSTGKKSPDYNGQPKLTGIGSSSVSWEYAPNWNVSVRENFPASSWTRKILYNLSLFCEINQYTYTFLVTNDHKTPIVSDAIHFIDDIDIYLDCVEQNTSIAMADGSFKRAADIRPGDRLLGLSGPVSVEGIDCGKHEIAARIEWKGGGPLFTSPDHPVMTDGGYVPAFRLKADDRVLSADGRHVTITSVQPVCGAEYSMVNLRIKGGSGYFAGGVAVGDTQAGAEMAQRDWVREELPEEWRADYDRAKEEGILYAWG